jgi:hypothetical protein
MNYQSEDEQSSDDEGAPGADDDMFSAQPGPSAKKRGKMNVSQRVEGEERQDPNFEYEEGVEMKIEPFNMEEELEEG